MKNKIISFFSLALLATAFTFLTAFAANSLELNSYSELEIKTKGEIKYVTGLSEGKKVSDLLSHFSTPSEITVTKNNVTLGKDDIVSTGAVVSCGNDEAYVVIKGDTNGDGYVNTTDYLQIKSYFLGKFQLSDVGFFAADTQEDDKINSTDYLQIKSYFLGIYNLYPEKEDTPTVNNVISSKTLKVEGNTISGVVPNSTEIFNFSSDICVKDNIPWVLSLDIYGTTTVVTKTVPLNVGENTFYLYITYPDQNVSTYIVNIYRNHMYTVTFDTQGGTSVATQYVEEGNLATEYPTTRDGYTFDGWNYDFSNPITSNTTITAKWIAHTNTPYKVEYYLENIQKTDYELLSAETQNLTGTTNTTVTAEEKLFKHFTLNKSKSTLRGNINAQGTLVLKVYYTRNTYTVTSSNDSSCVFTGGGTYPYGTEITATVKVEKIGYNFIGWYSGETFLSSNEEYTFIVDKNVTAKVEVIDELKNYNFTSTATTCEITGVKDNTITQLVVPDFVTSIGSGAFRGCTSLTSVTIPDSVTSIGSSAFYNCTSLKSITLPFVGATKDGTSNTHFGYIFGASSYSYNENYVPTSLKTVIITGGSSIGSYAFYNCAGITSITIPSSITSIREGGFYKCTNLEKITIPDSIIHIGPFVFGFCTSLKSVIIPDCITTIGSGVFEYCTNLESVTLPFVGENKDGTVNTNFSYVFGTVPDSLKNVIITGGSFIDSSAFAYCTSIRSIAISYGVTSIGKNAFIGCTNLKSITIPDSVTSIGMSSFKDCTSLVTITIPDGVTAIGDRLFYNCKSLTDITLPNSVKSIGYAAFWNCTSLESIIIPDSVTSIGASAFIYCTSLENITIPDSVTSIGSGAFENCTSLTSITIPDSVTSIGNYVFEDCTNLTSINYNGTLSQWNNISKGSSWNYNTGNYTIYCTDGTISK